ncbi:MAG: replication-associated recombination protein A [Gammaproteobacteria bacterium]|nr:replication-associated recombination protein A [Gammaproteobacteria bacterium]
MTDLLSEDNQFIPLADRMRPKTLDYFFGQQHLLAKGKPLRLAIESNHLHSMLFWGPPGTGKTTLARLIAHYCDAHFISLSAVMSGVKDIRQAIEEAKNTQAQTVLFIDEVHRFNKSQQDAFLPFIEDGTIVFVGATTENPSFELNNALLSRCRTYVLKSLQTNELESIVQNAISQQSLFIEAEALSLLVDSADGDARKALTFLEIASDLVEDNSISEDLIKEIVIHGSRRFDKKGDLFYEQISALHKSVRGSDPDASLYWFCRMIDGGCDPLYVARRLIRIASEDIGNADPRALEICLNAWQTYERLGSPEGELALAQAVVYLASAAKSNAVYTAYKLAMKDAQQSSSLDVPMHLRNAPTKLMKQLDYGKDYRYAHDESGAYARGENYFPEEMKGTRYYEPVERGLEIKIKQKLDYLRGL